ncbi:MAG TPA: IPT/TIG domain-containing protein [Cyclobacteriaceae bacterium]|nr:IPT/TIG domain-containing protein [Cyclobacteriaceae bacterium]
MNKIIAVAALFTLVFWSSCNNEPEPPTPAVISSFEPTSGKIGTLLTIHGGNFGEAPVVTINGTEAGLNLVADDKLMVTVQPGTTTGKITITNQGVESTTSENFVLVSAPTIASFTPATGNSNTEVTITGTNFSTDTGVFFGDIQGTVTSQTETTIIAKVPVGAFPSKIKVSNLAGSATSNDLFAANPPTISTTFTSVGIGQKVIVTVTNFAVSNVLKTIQFDGKDLLELDNASLNCYNCYSGIIPAGVHTGKFTVIVNGYSVTSDKVITVAEGGHWLSGIDFPGLMYTSPASFKIGDNFYYGIGGTINSGSGTVGPPDAKFWKFNITTELWSAVSPYIGTVVLQPSGDAVAAASGTFSFAIDGKGYVGGGYSYNIGAGTSKDFCEYDPAANAWVKKNPLSETLSKDQYGFANSEKGYVVSRQGVVMEYDPVADTWTPKTSLPGSTPLTVTTKVVYNNKAYIALTRSGSTVREFWEYDMATDIWTQKANYPGSADYSFEIGGKIYAGASQLSMYDPALNTWVTRQPSPLPATGPGFSSGTKGYAMSVYHTNFPVVNNNILYRFQME